MGPRSTAVFLLLLTTALPAAHAQEGGGPHAEFRLRILLHADGSDELRVAGNNATYRLGDAARPAGEAATAHLGEAAWTPAFDGACRGCDSAPLLLRGWPDLRGAKLHVHVDRAGGKVEWTQPDAAGAFVLRFLDAPVAGPHLYDVTLGMWHGTPPEPCPQPPPESHGWGEPERRAFFADRCARADPCPPRPAAYGGWTPADRTAWEDAACAPPGCPPPPAASATWTARERADWRGTWCAGPRECPPLPSDFASRTEESRWTWRHENCRPVARWPPSAGCDAKTGTVPASCADPKVRSSGGKEPPAAATPAAAAALVVLLALGAATLRRR